MKREDLHFEDLTNPREVRAAIRGSLNGLLEATEQYRRDKDPVLLLAGVVASLIIIHQILDVWVEGVDGDRP